MAENSPSATVGERQIAAALRRIRLALIGLSSGDPGDPKPIRQAGADLRDALRFLGELK